jgi:hypothetical protein
MKGTLLLSLFALLLMPALAVSESPAQTPTPALSADFSGCDSALSFLNAAPMTSATADLPALSPLAGAEEKAVSCCTLKRLACQRGCVCGVFEFNCDPATCQSSCICNLCP